MKSTDSMDSNEVKQSVLVDEFWQISFDFYKTKLVKELLLGLQDQHDYSVNRLLFALWYSQFYQQIIDSKRLDSCSEVLLKTEQSVSDLRKARQLFEKNWQKPYLGNINMARYHILEGELSLEKEIQSLLVSGLCDERPKSQASISAESLDFLIEENIGILCQQTSHSQMTSSEDSATQQLSMLWIQQQDCYNPRLFS